MTRIIGTATAVIALFACDGSQRRDKQSRDTPPASDSATAALDEPVFEIALWPGEGIPVLEGVADTLTLRAEPLVRSADVATLTGMRAEAIAYDSARYQTIESARATAEDSVQIHAREFGALRFLARERYTANVPMRVLNVARGAVIEYLQPRAEGTCFISADGVVLEADPCIVLDASKFVLQGKPVTRWWVHVTPSDTPGWLLITDSTVRVVRRTF